jgi:signal transduction histidine kinase
LRTLAKQGAVAIENARLHQAKIDALEQSKKELEQLNKAKSRALDHLSHELRTPLAVVQGNIRLVKGKVLQQPSTSPFRASDVPISRQTGISAQGEFLYVPVAKKRKIVYISEGVPFASPFQ